MSASNILCQSVAAPDQEHGQHQEEEEGGVGECGWLDTSKGSQLILSICSTLIFWSCDWWMYSLYSPFLINTCNRFVPLALIHLPGLTAGFWVIRIELGLWAKQANTTQFLISQNWRFIVLMWIVATCLPTKHLLSRLSREAIEDLEKATKSLNNNQSRD